MNDIPTWRPNKIMASSFYRLLRAFGSRGGRLFGPIWSFARSIIFVGSCLICATSEISKIMTSRDRYSQSEEISNSFRDINKDQGPILDEQIPGQIRFPKVGLIFHRFCPLSGNNRVLDRFDSQTVIEYWLGDFWALVNFIFDVCYFVKRRNKHVIKSLLKT